MTLMLMKIMILIIQIYWTTNSRVFFGLKSIVNAEGRQILSLYLSFLLSLFITTLLEVFLVGLVCAKL
jgi:hypothetical protein